MKREMHMVWSVWNHSERTGTETIPARPDQKDFN